jgi:two-component system LytT family sensor kinase
MTKRIILHVLFWSAYMAQDTLLTFLWESSTFKYSSKTEQLLDALGNCFVFLLPKLLLTYYILIVWLPKTLKGNRKHFNSILHVSIAVILALLLYRAASVYIVSPVVYHDKSPAFFIPLGFLEAFMDLGFASGAAIVIKQIRSQLEARDIEKALIKEKLETELKFLKNQTNPHFLFNTLNNIYVLARKKSDITADVVMKLSKILRYMIYESGKSFITIAEETKIIEDYLDLERIRYNDRLNITFKKELDNKNQLVSPLLLLPFVENAFKHGISETRFNSYIMIDLKLQAGRLIFSIENSKDVESGPAGENKIGIGNVKRQLELMYREFHLETDEKEETFTINLWINLNSHEKI